MTRLTQNWSGQIQMSRLPWRPEGARHSSRKNPSVSGEDSEITYGIRLPGFRSAAMIGCDWSLPFRLRHSLTRCPRSHGSIAAVGYSPPALGARTRYLASSVTGSDAGANKVMKSQAWVSVNIEERSPRDILLRCNLLSTSHLAPRVSLTSSQIHLHKPPNPGVQGGSSMRSSGLSKPPWFGFYPPFSHSLDHHVRSTQISAHSVRGARAVTHGTQIRLRAG